MDLEAKRERLSEILGVQIPTEDSPVWVVITRLGAALLDELVYQDERVSCLVREQAEQLAAASVVSPKFLGIGPPPPALARRCSSVRFLGYLPSSRLAPGQAASASVLKEFRGQHTRRQSRAQEAQ